MKIQKTRWSTIIVVLLLTIILALFAVINTQKVGEANQLRNDAALAEKRLNTSQTAQFNLQHKELTEQLNQLSSQLDVIKAKISQPMDTISISNNLFQIADTCGIEITQFSVSGLTTFDISGVSFSALPFSITINGTVSNIIKFILKLTENLNSSMIKTVKINTSQVNGEEIMSATIRLDIYTYKGSGHG